jgi:CheY-like chemotaxis protein
MARILIIDDDDDLRAVVSHVLDSEHQVETANDGLAAVATIRAGRRFDIILSDVNMPRLDGIQLYWQLIELAPEQAHRMVFMSGGDYELAARHQLTTGGAPTLAKPFSPARLLALVADLLALWE